MTASEKVWAPLAEKWGMYEPFIEPMNNLQMIRHYLKRLASYRLPIAAIEDLEQLIIYLDMYYAEE